LLRYWLWNWPFHVTTIPGRIKVQGRATCPSAVKTAIIGSEMEWLILTGGLTSCA
jgi:hypothetical protein